MKAVLYIAQLCIYTLLVLSANAQHPHPSFINYTSDDGLPSSEVHVAFQDSKGYMWFGTDNGLSRFDGYEFKNYSAAEGLLDPVVFDILEDKKGQLWAMTMSGQLFIKKEDKLVPFARNNEILKYQNEFRISEEFQFNADETKLYLSMISLGVIEFNLKNDTYKIIRPSESSNFHIDSADILIRGNYSNMGVARENIDPLVIITETRHIKHDIKGIRDGTGSNNLIIPGQSSNQFVLQDGHRLFLFKENGLVQSGNKKVHYTSHINYNGKIWLAQSDFIGIEVVDSIIDIFKENNTVFLPHIYASNFCADNQGGLWVCTIENGIFHCPNPENVVYDQSTGLQEDFVKSITLESDSVVFLALWNEDLNRLDHKNDRIEFTWANPYKMTYNYDLHFDQRLKKLLATPYASVHKLNDWYQLVTNNKDKSDYRIGGYNISTNDNNGHYILSGASALFFIDLSTEKITWAPYHGRDNKLFNSIRILDSNYDKNGQAWIAKMDGLWRVNKKQFFRPEKLDSIHYQRVEAVEFLSDNTMVLGTKGNGVVIGYQKGNTRKITTADGLTSNNIENIHIDSEDQIWVGTLNGLNRIRLTEAEPKIKVFTKKHGLASNEITKVRTQAGITWVATNKGLCKLTDMVTDTATISPLITAVYINDKLHSAEKENHLKHNENNLQINYVALDYKAQGEINYRFRMDQSSEWQTTDQRVLNFSNLGSGDYNFEIQAQNSDRFWSSSAVLAFEITAPFWQKIWFYILLSLGIIGLSYVYYKKRLKAISEEMHVQEQLVDLERSALQAQMNPHFIFNILNSIQSAITDNDSTKASLLLAKFAKLVRTTLNNARAKNISLSEEISYIESYLYLEKVRHKNKFNYNIDCDPDLDQYDIELPPMLTQPFVENAIEHGMQNVKGGHIQISYQQVDKSLQISVKDNGAGFESKSNGERQYEPVGMKITEKRLQLIEATTNKSPLTINHLKDDIGKPNGTEIIISIKIQQSNSKNKIQSS